jgi:anti-anti-sigma regulatory factor
MPSFPDRPDVLRATFEGRLTSPLAHDVRHTLARLASFRPRTLVVDLSRVAHLDATVACALTGLERRLEGAGGRLVVLAHGPVRTTLVGLGMARLTKQGSPGSIQGSPPPAATAPRPAPGGL